MAKLEKTKYPTYSLELPFSKQTVHFRTWNMAEHKKLVMAFDGKDTIEIQETILDVLRGIVLDETNVDKLPAIETDFFFLRARAKSVGEIVKISLKRKETNQEKGVGIDVSKLEISIPENRNYKIPILDTDGKETKFFLMMKELSAGDRLEILKRKNKDPENTIEEIETALKCADKVCDDTEQTDAAEQIDQLRDLMISMSPKQYEPIDTFLTESPIIRHEIDVSKVFPDAKGVFVVEGIESFFE